MIKLVVTDMDGTLLDDNHEINESFWGTLDKLKGKNIQFCVASGRQYHNLLEKFRGHENGLIFIAENGTIIMKDHVELFSKCLDNEGIEDFVEISRKLPEVYVVLCGKKSAYIESKNEDFIKEVGKYYHHYEVVEDVMEIKDDILKIALFNFENSEKEIYPHYKKFEEKYKVVVSGKTWVDIMDKEINKGVALNKLKEKLNITSENVLAFGDYLNDYEMMMEANLSYAMKNAHPELKKVAKFEAPSNNENGVVEVINTLIK